MRIAYSTWVQNEPSSEPWLLTADAIVAMDGALPAVLKGGGIVITGERITAVGAVSELRTKYGELPTRNHAGILLPGFVNAHTHLELSYMSAEKLRGGHFTQWVSGLMRTYPAPENLEAVVREAIRKGITGSLLGGITTLGDITRHSAITRSELASLARSSSFRLPRVVSFGEVLGLGKLRDRAAALIDAAVVLPPLPPDAPASASLHLLAGISPHAPYTVEGPTLRACVRKAIVKHLPLAMHLAELAEEPQFLENQSGPLGRDWDVMLKMDILDDRIPAFRGGPVRWAQLWGLLVCDPQNPPPRNLPVLLAHVNYAGNAEIAQLASARASVAYCPRTHAYFGHQTPHRYRDMLASGVNVCLATDSLASNPDLKILKEAQFLHQRDQLDPYVALEMITRRGAIALGMESHVGSLSPGKFADIIAFPLQPPGKDLFPALVSQAPDPLTLWINGKRLPQS